MTCERPPMNWERRLNQLAFIGGWFVDVPSSMAKA